MKWCMCYNGRLYIINSTWSHQHSLRRDYLHIHYYYYMLVSTVNYFKVLLNIVTVIPYRLKIVGKQFFRMNLIERILRYAN